jgi:2-C-methyl-D-erythritol 4-phosphate cytidylyltransferase
MPTPFVAIVGSATSASVPLGLRSRLLAAGAGAVLSWSELTELAAGELDDAPAVLFDHTADAAPFDVVALADLTAALGALAQVDGALDAVAGSPGAVIVRTRPVTDTLKLVDVAGTLTGTAEREEHRFVGTPIAARLGVLRSVPAAGPDPVAILAALDALGVTLIGISG